MLKYSGRSARFTAETGEKFRYTVGLRRGTQVVRERSAKPLYVGSIPTRASTSILQIPNVYRRSRIVHNRIFILHREIGSSGAIP